MVLLDFLDFFRQSVIEAMGKICHLEHFVFLSLPPFNNVEQQRAKFASGYVMGLQHCVEGERYF